MRSSGSMRMIWGMTAAFSMFLAVLILIADVGRGERLLEIMDALPGSDKTGHFVLMGTLSLLLNLSLNAVRVQVRGMLLLKGSLIAAGVVFAEECSQALLSARGFSLFDLAADMVGIVLFGRFAAWLLARHDDTPPAPPRSGRYSGKSGGIGGGTA